MKISVIMRLILGLMLIALISTSASCQNQEKSPATEIGLSTTAPLPLTMPSVVEPILPPTTTDNLMANKYLNIPYAQISGVDPNSISLDIYTSDNARDFAVMVWVHGGGWAKGDKNQVANLPDVCSAEGFVLVSVNYRLDPQIKYDLQAQDVATAIAWVNRHAAEYGGDPDKICLIGHSAGSHLVSLVATDASYLESQGLHLDVIKGVVALDTEVYNIPAFAARFGGKLPELYEKPFTQDSAVWVKASPITHVSPGKDIPPIIVAYSGGQSAYGNPDRAMFAEQFVNKLAAAGIKTELVAAPEKTHAEIAQQFGAPGDHVAEKVFVFLHAVLNDLKRSQRHFIPEDIRLGTLTNAYHDPEFIQNGSMVTFLDEKLDLWVGLIDPATGLFKNSSGRDYKIDTGISKWSFYSNGPEWGLDANGLALFYLKDNTQGVGQLWRADPPWSQPTTVQLTQDTDIHNWICTPSVNDNLPSTRVIVYHGRPGDLNNVDAWIDEEQPGRLVVFAEPMIVARWGYDTPFITFAYRVQTGQTGYSQGKLVDTNTGQIRTITNDAGNKIDTWIWHAPEFGGELLLCVNIDNYALGIYRDLKKDGSPWQRITTLCLPPDAPHQYLKSVEPINGGNGAFGRSYFTVQAGDDKDIDTSIWLFGFSPDGNNLIRRLDDGVVTGKSARRLDPESYIGTEQLYVYYTLVGESPSQLHRCATGVHRTEGGI